MGGKTMEIALLIEAPSPTAKLVLIALAGARNEETGDCWPSRDELSMMTGYGARAIHDALISLEDKGIISRFRRRDRETGLPAPDAFDLRFLRDTELREGKDIDSREVQDSALRQMHPAANANNRGDKGFSSSSHASNATLSRAGASFPSLPSEERIQEKRLGEDAVRARPSRAQSRKLAQAALAIWEVTPLSPRARCRNDVAKVEFALKDAAAEGQDLDEIVAGCRAYYASRGADDGRAAAAPNVLVDRGYWRSDAPVAAQAPAKPLTTAQTAAFSEIEAKWEPTLWGGPAGFHPIGTVEEPGAMRQYRWLDEHFGRRPDERDLLWDPRQGPLPGKPGSRVWPGLLDRYLQVNPKANT